MGFGNSFNGGVVNAIADNSVTTAKIVDGAVTTAKILDANVTALKLASDSVTTVKIVDANVTPAKLSQPFTSSLSTALSGTQIDFTNIPSWVKRIEIPVAGMSTNGTAAILAQIGDSGGIENTGYLSSVSVVGASSYSSANSTSGFPLAAAVAAASVLNGLLSFALVDSTFGYTWSATWMSGGSDATYTLFSGGSKTLDSPLDRIRLVAGGDSFDGGFARINYYG